MAIIQSLRKSFIKVLPEVAEALSSGRPVVALESTIVAQGMPYPQNLDLAKDVSQILREKVSVAIMFHFSDDCLRVGQTSIFIVFSGCRASNHRRQKWSL